MHRDSLVLILKIVLTWTVKIMLKQLNYVWSFQI